ncbi:WYL domain-containing protein [Paenibacillus sp. R14(2021)]|uniref:WYL domain-containing protein n=1 Tax=Paenibacillus sp. R14(2021) TaxID=2859228 RepID=UPI0021572BB8|nr:WYL domain-containing protein [Paenibacillus sp. R14(2021)]
MRSFRVDRIISTLTTEAVFERPANFSARSYMLQELKPWAYKEEEELTRVILRGKPETLNALCETWLFSDSLAERTKDEAHFLLDETAIDTYLPYHVLGYDTRLQVEAPRSLKERLIALTEELHVHYKSTI